MIENKVVPVEESGHKGGRETAADGPGIARDYGPRLSRFDPCANPKKAFSQSTVAVDNFVGKPGAMAGRGRQIKALDNLPQV